ncbi:MAG: trypsin-like peptidase domain-containing protein [Nitrospirota bacterium]|nr:trypsin-like peptidase domain-containing protein [Nitrospirota bacterium]
MESGKNTSQPGTEGRAPAGTCPRNYKPWVWTLVVMAILTLAWAVYENVREDGIVDALLDAGDFAAAKNGDRGPVTRTAAVKGTVGGLQLSYHDIIETVRPAVISVNAAVAPAQMGSAPAGTTPSLVAGLPAVNYTRVGSGVIIDSNGYVLSSLHVIKGASVLKATVYGKGGSREYPLKVVNADNKTDLVLLRIQGEERFPYATLGDSDMMRTGDVVLAMGSPFGFDQTITAGIISSRHRTLRIGNEIYEDVIQTDTPINKGNSGGPLVNVRGEVIGLNTAIYSPTGSFSGIGFSIPVNSASTLVSGVVDFRDAPVQVAGGQIVAWTRQGRQRGNSYKLPGGQIINPPHQYRGKCRDCHPQLKKGITGFNVQQAAPVPGMQQNSEPFLGMNLIEVNDVVARRFGLLNPRGLLVDRVYPGTPAAEAGLSRGDIIMRVDGRKIRGLKLFKEVLASKRLGESFDLVLWQNGGRETVTVRSIPYPAFMPGQQPGGTPGPAEFEWLGAEFMPLDAALSAYVKHGVYVAEVEGFLSGSGLQKGDIIQAFDGKNVTDMNAFIGLAKRARPRKGFLLEILRSGSPMYISVKG